MNVSELRSMSDAIASLLNEEAVWALNKNTGNWFKLKNSTVLSTRLGPLVIEDQFFEERKAFIEGKKISVLLENTEDWIDTLNPAWDYRHKYKIKEPAWYEDPDMVGKYVVHKGSGRIQTFLRHDPGSRSPIVCDRDIFGYDLVEPLDLNKLMAQISPKRKATESIKICDKCKLELIVNDSGDYYCTDCIKVIKNPLHKIRRIKQ